MSRWELLKKALSAGGEEAAIAAKQVLEEVSSPEIAQALKGSEREAYLNALDVTHGDRAKRAKVDYEMGDISDHSQDWYHGSFGDIKEFNPAPTKGTTPYLGEGTYLSTSPEDASSYASLNNVDTQYKLEKIAERLRDSYDIAPGPAYKTAKNKITKGLDSGAVYPVRLRMTDEAPKYVDKPYTKDFDMARAEVKNDDIALMHPGDKWPHMDNITRDDMHARVKDSSKIRSINAAFDPRFKDSKNILAGGAGVALLGTAATSGDAQAEAITRTRQGPEAFTSSNREKDFFSTIGDLMNEYSQNVVEPIATPIKEALNPVIDAAKDLTSPLKADPELHNKYMENKNLNDVSDFGVEMLSDPLNYVGTGAGLGATRGFNKLRSLLKP